MNSTKGLTHWLKGVNAMAEPLNTAEPSKKSLSKTIKDILSYIIPALIGMALFIFVFKIAVVSGNSMNDTYQNSDILLCLRLGKIERGNVIVCDYINEYSLIKRVIGVEGDTVEISRDGTVTVNGEILYEPYIKEPMNPIDEEVIYTVPKDCYFVMGDNRNNSKDSRDNSIGYINKDIIQGKVLCELS